MTQEKRVFGGNPNLIHVDDGLRADMGQRMAAILDAEMRSNYSGERTPEQLRDQPLCPGCYMIVAFNMLLTLAERNKQDFRTVARTMRNAFDCYLETPDGECIEEIAVMLDPE